jgi:hypothetical protein
MSVRREAANRQGGQGDGVHPPAPWATGQAPSRLCRVLQSWRVCINQFSVSSSIIASHLALIPTAYLRVLLSLNPTEAAWLAPATATARRSHARAFARRPHAPTRTGSASSSPRTCGVPPRRAAFDQLLIADGCSMKTLPRVANVTTTSMHISRASLSGEFSSAAH